MNIVNSNEIDLSEQVSDTTKIFIPAIGTLGDIQPYLILAKELKKQGYIVWLGVHQQYQGYVENNGTVQDHITVNIFCVRFFRNQYCGNWR